MAKIREQLPDVEFILVASMLGNRELDPAQARTVSPVSRRPGEASGPGIALADLTSVWDGFLELKQDWDQTGNGVNHPNDFGHRVYAQVLQLLLVPAASPPPIPSQP